VPGSRLSRALVVGAIALTPTLASAEALNLPVAARVISFVQPPPNGTVVAAIVYDPRNPASEAEADAIERGAATAFAAGKATLKFKRVPVTALAGLTGSQVAFVTTGLREGQAQLGAAAARQSILTITADLTCVQAGNCAVAISGGQRVQITVSRAACKAGNLRFGSAFLMLVKEV